MTPGSRGDHSKDIVSRWLLGSQAGSILRLGGVTGFTGWTAAESGLMTPQRRPDGLIHVTFADDPEPVPYLIEIETYASSDADRQVYEDLLLAAVDRRVVPEAICLVLRPKGNAQVTGQYSAVSRRGTSRLSARWDVVRLWELKAADLLATGDPGLIPWVPLTQIDGPAEIVLQECRDRIERDIPPERRVNYCAATEVLGRLVHPFGLLERIFAPEAEMIESPLFQDLECQATQRNIRYVLEQRFGPMPDDLRQRLRSIFEFDRLQKLLYQERECSNYDDFRALLEQPAGN